MPSLVWKTNEEDDLDGAVKKVDIPTEEDVDIDLREVYFLICIIFYQVDHAIELVVNSGMSFWNISFSLGDIMPGLQELGYMVALRMMMGCIFH